MSYGFKAYGIDQGLSSPSIITFIQDLEGFLWVGTEDGLFRLEGDKFRRFGVEDGLPANRIDGLSFARPAGIWATTPRGIAWTDGNQFLRPRDFGFTGLDERPGIPLPSGGIILSNLEGQQRFFSSTDGKGFFELKGLPSGGGASCAFFDKGRNLLVIALQEGIWIWDGRSWKSRAIFDASEKDKRISSIHLDRKGRFWLRQTGRIFRLENFDAPLKQIPAPEPLTLVSDSFVCEDADGRIWTNSGRSLVWFSDSGSGVLGEREGLPPGAAFAFHFDRQGTLWVGGDGIFKLLGDFLWTSATRKEGLPGDVTWSVCRTRDGRIWAGTSGGLAYGTPEGWRPVPGTAECQIMSLFEDTEGVLWVGHTLGGVRTSGLMKILPGRTEALTVALKGGDFIGPINAMAQGPGETLWIGDSGSGLKRGVPGPDGVRLESVEISDWPAQKTYVLNIARDGSGGLWVACSLGAAHWDGKTWAVLPKGTLPNQELLCILPLGPGSAWFSPQYGRQLSRLERQGSSLQAAETLPPDHPLSQALIFGLKRDAQGAIWVASARGLLRWEAGRVEKYGRNAGLPGEDCAQNALWVDPAGDVWAGLSIGLAHGDMDRRREPQLPPAVSILEKRFGPNLPFIEISPAFAIPWKASSVFFRYAARGSKWTDGIEYQVRIVGLEDAWRATDILEARYPKLAPGSYRFEVRSVSAARESGPVQSVSFRILAPWWTMWWAKVFYGVLAVLIGALIYLRRTAVLRRRNEFLEALVEARTGELEQANKALREAILIDPLTGLYNRRYLTITMPEEEIRLRRMFRNYFKKGISPLNQNEDLVLFLGDMDHFKIINDTYGHTTGDHMIQETARVLKSVCRTADTLVRWGGEEFLLVARRSDREKAHQIAEKLCQAVRDHVFTLPNGGEQRCTISFGFAAFPILDQHPEAFTWEDTLQVADRCLYEAKNAGRDGWVGIMTSDPLDPAGLAPRLRADLKGLVRDRHVHVQTSFPPGKVFV